MERGPSRECVRLHLIAHAIADFVEHRAESDDHDPSSFGRLNLPSPHGTRVYGLRLGVGRQLNHDLGGSLYPKYGWDLEPGRRVAHREGSPTPWGWESRRMLFLPPQKGSDGILATLLGRGNHPHSLN